MKYQEYCLRRNPIPLGLSAFQITVLGTALRASTAKMHLVQVAEEIITLLAGDPNANLEITLEISAEFPSGASDQVKRAVSENATALGFKTKVWE